MITKVFFFLFLVGINKMTFIALIRFKYHLTFNYIQLLLSSNIAFFSYCCQHYPCIRLLCLSIPFLSFVVIKMHHCIGYCSFVPAWRVALHYASSFSHSIHIRKSCKGFHLFLAEVLADYFQGNHSIFTKMKPFLECVEDCCFLIMLWTHCLYRSYFEES